MADVIIITILLLLAVMAIRSITRRKKGGCNGNCSCCGGCHARKKDSEKQ